MSQYWGTGRPGITQATAYTSAAAQITNAFSSGLQRVRVMATTDVYLSFTSTSPSSDGTHLYLAGLTPEYFTINPSQKPSAAQVASAGILYVTEIS